MLPPFKFASVRRVAPRDDRKEKGGRCLNVRVVQLNAETLRSYDDRVGFFDVMFDKQNACIVGLQEVRTNVAVGPSPTILPLPVGSPPSAALTLDARFWCVGA